MAKTVFKAFQNAKGLIILYLMHMKGLRLPLADGGFHFNYNLLPKVTGWKKDCWKVPWDQNFEGLLISFNVFRVINSHLSFVIQSKSNWTLQNCRSPSTLWEFTEANSTQGPSWAELLRNWWKNKEVLKKKQKSMLCYHELLMIKYYNQSLQKEM